MFRDLGTIPFHESQKRAYREGILWKEWADRYPELFDDLDLSQAKSQADLGYHFFEWLAAIVLYSTTGHLSLVAKYEFPKHERKHEVFRSLVSDPVYAAVRDRTRFGGVQCPDLFLFDQDRTDWFFCEVKGPGDRLRPTQREYFEHLAELSGRSVRVLRFREVES